MHQYSEYNQAFLLRQLPTATDVRPLKAWNAAGRSVRRGQKALRVWIPKRGTAIPADLSTMTETQQRQYFVLGPVFDISQTKPMAPRHLAKQANQHGRNDIDALYEEYGNAVERGDIPPDFDIGIWMDLRQESITNTIMAAVAAESQPVHQLTAS
jgi:hypothetical protein